MTDAEFRNRNWQRVAGSDRTSNGNKKARRGREFATERARENFGIVSKMQARNVDPAAEVCRKVDRR
jgi:hypothetical protein